jgi:hypothetical protein
LICDEPFSNNTSKSGFALLFCLGHSAFGAGVVVTIVRTSKVGVKVEMIDKGVILGGAGVSVDCGVPVGEGERVSVWVAVEMGKMVADASFAVWEQAVTRKQRRPKAARQNFFKETQPFQDGYRLCGTP